ncbi:nucleotide-binding protein [Thomasclavelia cocleata]|uniref:nucleotide-binding protein n=1 Tax=Thomasclavelia cocleata TaxID=69824 RepID=UPI00272E9E56|nr:nucleotide-binding protein [Thomasclavelia cocleata]
MNKDKLQELCAEIDILINSKATYRSPQFIAWQHKVKRFLLAEYGEKSIEYKNFNERLFAPIVCEISHDFSIECRQDLEITKLDFMGYLEDLENAEEKNLEKDNRKVFIVHGHDELLKEKVSNWLYSLELDPIILHKQANRGTRSVIDKIEKYSNVRCAIVLMTADDNGKGKKEEEYKNRARQNVIFEAGYFIGKLGVENVILLYEEGVEIPGDLGGCIYIKADKNDGWKEQVRMEFNEMGLKYKK